MGALEALGFGLRAARQRKRLVVGLFLLNLLWALAWSGPFFATFQRATADRPYADILARGLHLDVLSEILFHHPDVAAAAQAGAFAGTLSWIILSWFLVAGVLGLLREAPEAASLRRFGAEAAGGGFRMARLQFWSLLPYGIALLIGCVGAAIGGGLGARAAHPGWMIGLAIVGALPGLVLWLAVATALDVARARTMLRDERVMGRVLWESLRLTAREPRRFMGVQVGGDALWLGASALYLILAFAWPYASVLPFVALTLMRQGLVLVRTGVRVGTLGGTLELTRRLLEAEANRARERALGTPPAPSGPPLAGVEPPLASPLR
ncbi:MAG TPA: hypothetical protein VKN99_03265 [Polyangia bacterium]|nr:hypothetical protein [Polyangia bacterium]